MGLTDLGIHGRISIRELGNGYKLPFPDKNGIEFGGKLRGHRC